MQKLLIAATEALSIALETRSRNWGIAITRMTIERGWPPRLYVMLCGFKSIV